MTVGDHLDPPEVWEALEISAGVGGGFAPASVGVSIDAPASVGGSIWAADRLVGTGREM